VCVTAICIAAPPTVAALALMMPLLLLLLLFPPQVYRCLTATPPPLGPAVHWVLVGWRRPGEPAYTRVVMGPEVPRAVRCELRVLQVRRAHTPQHLYNETVRDPLSPCPVS
jgi:hypothetical protein